MARRMTPVDTKLVVVAAAVERLELGERVNVRALAVRLGISRKTFYKWAGRYRSDGLAGLEERSRRPHRSPGRLPLAVEDAVVELRKRLSEDGLDAGPATIAWHLARRGVGRATRSAARIWGIPAR